MEIFERHDGEMLAVEAPEVLEGEWPVTRTVLIRFPQKLRSKPGRARTTSALQSIASRHRSATSPC